MSGTCMQSTAGMEPNWARVPPHVPTYPNPPAYFRFTPADKYTSPPTRETYQKWWSKWHTDYPHTEYPGKHDEYLRFGPETPVMRQIQFKAGTTAPPFKPSWDHPAWRQEYSNQGVPVTEAVRARGMNRIQRAYNDEKVYQFSNAMTSTQYKKPVPGIFGPLKRQQVYGVDTQHNRHGFMPFTDYYF